MNKEELINSICKMNKNAKPEILQAYTEEQLKRYIQELLNLEVHLAEAVVD